MHPQPALVGQSTRTPHIRPILALTTKKYFFSAFFALSWGRRRRIFHLLFCVLALLPSLHFGQHFNKINHDDDDADGDDDDDDDDDEYTECKKVSQGHI